MKQKTIDHAATPDRMMSIKSTPFYRQSAAARDSYHIGAREVLIGMYQKFYTPTGTKEKSDFQNQDSPDGLMP